MELVHADGTGTEQEVRERAIVAYAIAAVSGQIPMFAGPPGSGKTTMAGWTSAALGFTSSVFPVRPGWIDPSDLLGYFDPLQGSFVPTRFLEELLKFEQDTAKGLALILDEMNIARIENYAADLLSQLEKAHIPGGSSRIPLYSESLRRSSAISSSPFRQLSDDNDDGKRPTVRSDFFLHPNLLLVGTLNHDHTTNDLSPKVLDRALVIKVPSVIAETLPTEQSRIENDFLLGPNFRVDVTTGKTLYQERAAAIWKLIRGFVLLPNQPHEQIFHLSRRSAAIISLLPAVAQILGISDERIADHFLCMKAMPLINGFRDQPGLDRANLLAYASMAEKASWPMTLAALKEMIDWPTDSVSYMR